jgi:hypothetical protein
MAYTITIDQFADALRTSFMPTVVAAMEEGLREGANEIKRETERVIEQENLIYSGWMEGSVYSKPIVGGGEVGVSAPHAKWVEYGTRPFRPPLEPLAIWAMLKLGLDADSAYRVAVSIREKFAREGIKPRRFFLRAIINSMPDVQRRVERRVHRAEKVIFRRIGRAVLG